MKKYFLVLTCAAALIACQSNTTDTANSSNENLSEAELNSGEEAEADVVTTNDSSSQIHFGKVIDSEGAIDLAEFEKRIREQDSINVKLKAVATEVCQKMGCWMKVELASGESMRVKFKDHSFFVPSSIVGKEVVFEGVAYRDVVSVEDQKHYLEDAGKTKEEIAAVTEAKTSITFQAEGVKLL